MTYVRVVRTWLKSIVIFIQVYIRPDLLIWCMSSDGIQRLVELGYSIREGWQLRHGELWDHDELIMVPADGVV